MRTDALYTSVYQRGVTLIELVIFIVVVSIALVILLGVLASQVQTSYDPVARVKALERGQAVLDEILSRKFADNTPTGGVPACSSCAPIGTATEGSDNDVGDYHNTTDATDPLYPVDILVTEAGADLPGVANEQARLITVTVSIPNGETLTLNAYKVNF